MIFGSLAFVVIVSRKSGPRAACRSPVLVGLVVQHTEDGIGVFGLADVQLEGRPDVLVPHDLLHLVRRYPIIGKPSAVRVPQIMEAQAAELVASYVHNSLPVGANSLP